MYAINGVFFQTNQSVGLACKPIEGVVAVVQEGTYYYPFAGLIGPDPRGFPSQLLGRTQDSFGNATLRDIQIYEDHLSFSKCYDGREDVINYTLRKQKDGTWAGTYTNANTGTGAVRMLLIELPDNFLDPFEVLRLTGRSELHTGGRRHFPEPVED